MSTDKDVVIVAAGSAYDLYMKYAMYFCQPGRSFQPIERIGFYTGNEIKPYFPRILTRHDHVGIDRASAHTLQLSSSKHEAAIGRIVERLLDDSVLREGDVQQVFLLSPADDPLTLVLPAPIQNVSVGPRGQRVAWTQKQRYISSAALDAAPKTTADLSGTTSLPGSPEPGPEGQTPWYQEIREIHDRHFHDDGRSALTPSTSGYALSGAHKLFTPDPGAPMPWFNGNIEAVEPGRWVLVISLNHYVNPDTRIALDSDASAGLHRGHLLGSPSHFQHRVLVSKILRSAGPGGGCRTR